MNRKLDDRMVIKWISFGVVLYLVLSNSKVLFASLGALLGLFAPLLLGLVLALFLNVPMSAIERTFFLPGKRMLSKTMVRFLSVFLTFLLAAGVVTGLFLLVVPELTGAVRLLSQILTKETERLEQSEVFLVISRIPVIKEMTADPASMERGIRQFLSRQAADGAGKLLETVKGTAGLVLDLCFGMVFAIYILAGKEKLKIQLGRLCSAWLSENRAKKISHILFVGLRTFRGFVIGQLTEAVILGSLCGLGMMILGLPYGGTVGALVGVTALIPIVGAFLGAGVGVLLLLTEGVKKAVIFLIFLVILQQLEGNIIYPKVVGARLNLPPIWVLAAVVIGGNVAGPAGMFLGVPVFSALYTLGKEATILRELEMAAGEKQNG